MAATLRSRFSPRGRVLQEALAPETPVEAPQTVQATTTVSAQSSTVSAERQALLAREAEIRAAYDPRINDIQAAIANRQALIGQIQSALKNRQPTPYSVQDVRRLEQEVARYQRSLSNQGQRRGEALDKIQEQLKELDRRESSGLSRAELQRREQADRQARAVDNARRRGDVAIPAQPLSGVSVSQETRAAVEASRARLTNRPVSAQTRQVLALREQRLLQQASSGQLRTGVVDRATAEENLRRARSQAALAEVQARIDRRPVDLNELARTQTGKQLFETVQRGDKNFILRREPISVQVQGRTNAISTGPVLGSQDSRVLGGNLLSSQVLSNQEEARREERVKRYEERLKKLEKDQELFVNPQGLRRIEETASFLTFGGGRLASERGFVGATATKVLSFPLQAVTLPGTVINLSGKAFALGEGLTLRETRGSVLEDLKSGFGKVEQTSFSFFPGGTPINPEGAATLITAAATGLGGARTAKLGEPLKAGPLSAERLQVETSRGTVEVRTVGLEVRGRGQPLTSSVTTSPRVTEGFTPTLLDKTPTPAQAQAALRSQTTLFLGRPRAQALVSTDTLLRAEAQPATAVGARAFDRLTDLSSAERVRLESATVAARTLQPERGLPVRQPLFPLESVKNPRRVTQIVDTAVGEEGGVFFGSVTTQQLPKGFQNVKVGDIDVIFPSKTAAQTETVVADIAGRLRVAGEEVRVSAANPKVIETSKGEKVLEAKSGLEPATLGEELAAPGFRGVRFPDLKAGQSPATVPFGSGRAITAGEQFARKGAASTFLNPPLQTEALPVAFQGGGVFGKVRPTDPRTLKDVAGFIQGGRGILAIRESRSPLQQAFEGFSTRRAERALTAFEQSFTPEQRVAIGEKLVDLTGNQQFALITPGTAKNIPAASPQASSRSSGFVTLRASPSVVRLRSAEEVFSSPVLRPVRSPSPSVFTSASPRTFFSPRASPVSSPSPSFSPSISPSPIGSPSPGFSPRPSPSPSTSPRSPSVSPSPSPSPSVSPKSPSASPRLSPSPSPSPSPSIIPGLRNLVQPQRRLPVPEFDLGRSEFVQGFRAYAKVGKEFVPVSGVRSRERALFEGASFVGKTSAATFELRRAGQVRASDFPGSRSEEDLDVLLSRFRAPQRGKAATFKPLAAPESLNRFVEKNRFRIDTPGELREITFKGIAARRKGAA